VSVTTPTDPHSSLGADFSPGYKRYALGALTAVYMLNLVDRGLIGVLLQPIKVDLQLTDSQLGVLTGVAFGFLYTVLGLPIARWSDRSNRVTIASVAICVWGLTVMSCLFVATYTQLLLARAAAAVGEAGCRPPTYSLVGDYFRGPAERSRAMAIYMLGGPLSALLSFMLGGWLDERYGWRLTLFMIGIPGLILALITKLTVVEPRTCVCKENPAEQRLPQMREVLKLIWARRSLRHLSIALILLYTLSYGLDPWYAAFMMRSHAMGTAEVGFWLGLVLSLAGIAGLLLGGYVATHWLADNERGQLRWSACAVGSSLVFFAIFLMVPLKYEAILALIPTQLMCIVFIGPVLAVMQRLVPDTMRATALAVSMLIANLVGMGVGPQIVGTVSDRLMPLLGSDSLRYAMLILCIAYLWPAYHLWRAAQTVQRELEVFPGTTGLRSMGTDTTAQCTLNDLTPPVQLALK
jgi:MFS family permease